MKQLSDPRWLVRLYLFPHKSFTSLELFVSLVEIRLNLSIRLRLLQSFIWCHYSELRMRPPLGFKVRRLLVHIWSYIYWTLVLHKPVGGGGIKEWSKCLQLHVWVLQCRASQNVTPARITQYEVVVQRDSLKKRFLCCFAFRRDVERRGEGFIRGTESRCEMEDIDGKDGDVPTDGGRVRPVHWAHRH